MSMNITTAAGTHARIEELEGMCFSDFHKDVYGYRPRGATWDSYVNMDADKLNAALDNMMNLLEEELEAEKKEQELALARLKLEMKGVMAFHSCNWKGALTLLKGEDTLDYFLWKRGVSFAKSNEIHSMYYDKE